MNRTDALNLIKKFAGQATILTIPAVFVSYTGSIDHALFLSQILYWTDKTHDPDGWIYKSYAEWQREIFLSEYQVRKAANHLKGMGILDTKIRKVKGSPTLHYRLNEANFSESFLKFLQQPKPTSSTNHPSETTGTPTIKAETTQQINPTRHVAAPPQNAQFSFSALKDGTTNPPLPPVPPTPLPTKHYNPDNFKPCGQPGCIYMTDLPSGLCFDHDRKKRGIR